MESILTVTSCFPVSTYKFACSSFTSSDANIPGKMKYLHLTLALCSNSKQQTNCNPDLAKSFFCHLKKKIVLQFGRKNALISTKF